MLEAFITANRAELINRCRVKVAARLDPVPTATEIDHGVPTFLDQLLAQLQHEPAADGDITATATQHGHDLFAQGYTVSQVVHDYGDVCQAVTELAVEQHAAIRTEDFRTLNRCLDDAIAGAVTEYGRERDRSTAWTATSAYARRETLARDVLSTIQIVHRAFDAIKSGRVGVAGSTGAMLGLGLDTARDLAERWLATEIVTPDPALDGGYRSGQTPGDGCPHAVRVPASTPATIGSDVEQE
jgi:hypothetical protein